MTTRLRSYLRSKFKTNDIPTQEDFADVFDSFLSVLEDKDLAVDSININNTQAITGVSTAVDLGAVSSSDSIVPTQKAVKTYVDTRTTDNIPAGSDLARQYFSNHLVDNYLGVKNSNNGFVGIDNGGNVNINGQLNASKLLGTTLGVGTASINNAAVAEFYSTTKGFLKPRMTTAEREGIESPPEGLEVYDTELKANCTYNGSSWMVESAGSASATGAAGQVGYFTGTNILGGDGNFTYDSINNRLNVDNIQSSNADFNAVKIGNGSTTASDGLIKYETRFQGYKSGSWVNLDFDATDARAALAVANSDFIIGAKTALLPDASIAQGQINFAIDDGNGRLLTKFRLNPSAVVNYTLPVIDGNASFWELTAKQSLFVGASGLPHTSALVEFNSDTKGVLLTRMTTDMRNNIVGPVDGLTIYNTDSNAIEWYDDSVLSFINPLARTNHTGTQTASTISDFNSAAVSALASSANNALIGAQYAEIADASLGLGQINPYINDGWGTVNIKWRKADNSIANGTIAMQDSVGRFFSLDAHFHNFTGETGSIHASAILQADSTTKGFLPPRMTSDQRNQIESPANGLTIYNTDNNVIEWYDNTTLSYINPLSRANHIGSQLSNTISDFAATVRTTMLNDLPAGTNIPISDGQLLQQALANIQAQLNSCAKKAGDYSQDFSANNLTVSSDTISPAVNIKVTKTATGTNYYTNVQSPLKISLATSQSPVDGNGTNISLTYDYPLGIQFIKTASNYWDIGVPHHDNETFKITHGATLDMGIRNAIDIRAMRSNGNISYFDIWFGGFIYAQGAFTNNYGASDIRVKKNISSLNKTSSLDILKQIKLYEFEYIDALNHIVANIKNKKLGVIAQELEEIMPSAVHTHPTFKLADESSIENFKSVTLDDIHYHHINVTQYLLEQVKLLSTSITELRSQVDQLMNNT